MPPYEKTEFERFVQAAVGRELRLFGHEFFEEVPSTFAPVDRVPVRNDYVVGPGDELLIRAWGKIDLDFRGPVDRNGQIYIPRVGALNVAGLRYEQLTPFIRSAVGRIFRDFDLNVSLGQLRSIQVFVLGYARRPGTYTVSSLSTLVNTLFASGGPASDGSMRHVQLKRNNTVLSDLDLYDVILKGDKSGDVPLLSNDVIYIPHVGPLVAVAGSVNRPAIYELRDAPPPPNARTEASGKSLVASAGSVPLPPVPDKPGSGLPGSLTMLGPATTLGEVLEDAGGLTSVAAAGRVSLERINSRADRAFDEFPIDPAGLRRELQDGDVVRVYPVSPRITNSVTLRGNVAQPGRYMWHEGMRVSDLIPSREVLITRRYWNSQNAIVPVERTEDEFGSRPRLYRRNGQQVGMGGGTSLPDETRNGAQNETQNALPSSQGEANDRNANDQLNSAEDQARAGLRDDQRRGDAGLRRGEEELQGDLRTEIKHRGSEINWEHAVIERLNKNDLTTELIPFNLGLAIDKPSSMENQKLAPGDVVTIFSQEDLPVATENRAKYVQIAGEVRAPGVYRVEPGETLRDAVVRAGGLGSHAYLYGAELLRESARDEQRKRLSQMVERMQREMQASAAAGGAGPEDRAEVKARLDEQKEFIAKLSRVQPSGRVVLELKPTASQVNDIPAMPLEDGDVFTVPAKGDTVQVLGSVYNENTFRFRPDKQVAAYLRIAGGPTRDADRMRTFVIHADGTVVSRAQQSGLISGNRFDSMRLMPGDAIIVPQRFKLRSGLTALRDWTAIFSQLALGAASINVIK